MKEKIYLRPGCSVHSKGMHYNEDYFYDQVRYHTTSGRSLVYL